jgi:hypothetical protein
MGAWFPGESDADNRASSRDDILTDDDAVAEVRSLNAVGDPASGYRTGKKSVTVIVIIVQPQAATRERADVQALEVEIGEESTGREFDMQAILALAGTARADAETV